MAEAGIDPVAVRAAMRSMASGVTVVTTAGPAGRAGLTVSSFSSLSMEPPSVLFCVHRQSRSLATLLENRVFAASVLAHGQSGVADAFAGFIAEFKEDKFRAGHWYDGPTGAPLLQDALCAFDCELAATFEFGSHHIVAGRVVSVAAVAAASPLLYSDRAYHRLHQAA